METLLRKWMFPEVLAPGEDLQLLRQKAEEAVYSAMEERSAQAFLDRLGSIRQQLCCDLEAALEADPAATGGEEVIRCYPGFYAVTLYRMAHALWELEVPILPRMLTERAHSRTGIDIHPGARIGGSFFIDHGTGVVIGETARIGDGVRLYHGVTLGALSTAAGRQLRGVRRHPTVGDGVTIYANATVLGGETVVGNGCVIGANAFITRSVEPGSRIPACTVLR